MALREGLPGTIYRKDYTVPDFAVTTVDLLVQITPGRTEVTATLEMERQGTGQGGLSLDGEQLSLQWVEVDGARLTEDDYAVGDTELVIASVPDRFSLRTCVTICPRRKYVSGGLLSVSKCLLHAV